MDWNVPLVTWGVLRFYIVFLFCGLCKNVHRCILKQNKTITFSFYSRPAELPKDIKVISPDLPIMIVAFLIVSWTTCGALAILLSYLYYVFKVCWISKARRPGLCIRHHRIPIGIINKRLWLLLSATFYYVRNWCSAFFFLYLGYLTYIYLSITYI